MTPGAPAGLGGHWDAPQQCPAGREGPGAQSGPPAAAAHGPGLESGVSPLAQGGVKGSSPSTCPPMAHATWHRKRPSTGAWPGGGPLPSTPFRHPSCQSRSITEVFNSCPLRHTRLFTAIRCEEWEHTLSSKSPRGLSAISSTWCDSECGRACGARGSGGRVRDEWGPSASFRL